MQLVHTVPPQHRMHSPGGPGIRLDGVMTAGAYVSRHYDSLLVKVWRG